MTAPIPARALAEPEPLARLRLVQWLSPAFPTGAFAYSHGLETVIAAGCVADAAGLERWLSEVLALGAGWQDSLLLAATLAAPHEADALDDLAMALQASAERAEETRAQGAAFASAAQALTGRALPPRALPVAVGEAAAGLGLPAEEVIGLYLLGFVTNLATIATRHVPLGQTEGQRVIAGLLPLVRELAARAAGASLDDLAGAAFAADIAAMQHETLPTRILRT